MFVGYNVADYRERAKRVIPKGLFEFVDRGSEDEVTLRRNRESIESIRLVTRVLRDVSRRRTDVELFGKTASMPVIVAPTGAAGLLWHEGELAIARAAAKVGVPFTLANGSLTSMERVAAEAGGRLWFQLYMWPDRAVSYSLIDRVRKIGFEALVVTVDLPVAANREYNLRNGFTIPFRLKRSNYMDILAHPRWCARVLGRYMLNGGLPRYENYPTEIKQKFTALPMGRAMPKTDSLDWSDLAELRQAWPHKLIVKGIQHPDDAERALALEADAIVVSNHGGRALDGAATPMELLPAIVARVGGRMPIFVDGGFVRGSSIVKALAMGASAVQVGRAVLYGVAAAGEEGATRVLRLLQEETHRVMGLIGCTSVEEVTAECLAADARMGAAARTLARVTSVPELRA